MEDEKLLDLRNASVTLVDAINNRPISRTTVVKVADDIWVLRNVEKNMHALLNKYNSYKLTLNNVADADYRVMPVKLTKEFLVVKLIRNASGRERRRFIRITCDLPTTMVYNNEPLPATILELSYGSIILKTKTPLEPDSTIVIRLKELDGEVVLACTVKARRILPNETVYEENDIWFDGYTYIILVDAKESGERAMDTLYSKIYRLQNEVLK